MPPKKLEGFSHISTPFPGEHTGLHDQQMRPDPKHTTRIIDLTSHFPLVEFRTLYGRSYVFHEKKNKCFPTGTRTREKKKKKPFRIFLFENKI